jgi:hypothetical protein
MRDAASLKASETDYLVVIQALHPNVFENGFLVAGELNSVLASTNLTGEVDEHCLSGPRLARSSPR